MIVLGLTGSIGMGKSVAARMLRIMGISVHDSDRAVHDALLPGGISFNDVTAIFPETVKAGVIDRKKLGDIVFHDPEKLKQLERVLHPVVQKSQNDFIRKVSAKGKKAAVLEIPLLFETGAESRADYTICVSAPSIIQKRRVMKRKNMDDTKFARILETQMQDAEKRARSDFVVETGLGYAHTYRSLYKILKKLGLK